MNLGEKCEQLKLEPKYRWHPSVRPEKCGECYTCIYDPENNKGCSGYPGDESKERHLHCSLDELAPVI